MKKSIKKILVFTIALITFCMTFTSCTSYDKNYTIYDLWVAGVKITTRNKADVFGDGTVSYKGNGKQGVLTLNGANLLDSFSVNSGEAVIVSGLDCLTIELVGENKIGMGEDVPINGISAYDLIIQGQGELQIGARSSCVMTKNLTIKSGKIKTFTKTPEEEIGSFLGIGLWAQELLLIEGGDIQVQYLASYSPLGYGIYSAQDLVMNGGDVTINAQTSTLLGIGIISSENLKINGGSLNLYGFDDAINAKCFEMSGGYINATALDFFSDGVCRPVLKAEFTGGEMDIVLLDDDAKKSTLYSTNLVLREVDVFGGASKDALSLKNADYDYIDNFIKIKKVGE